jgi:serine/threonine-protein kinase
MIADETTTGRFGVFGHYRLEAELGRGGMGVVFRAYDTQRNRIVALKRMPHDLAANEEFRTQFRRESALVAKLREPHIVPIHDYGEIDGQLYIDMRLVEGVDLGSVLRQAPLSLARAVDIISQIADALDAAHAEGLVHRDVKPSNMLLVGKPERVAERGFAYLADFGIAANVGGSTLNRPGLALGTTSYMAPERLVGEQWDHRVDVYSLACVLFESVIGRRPYPASDLLEAVRSHVYGPIPRPSELGEGLPPALDDVLAVAMAKRAADRFGSCGELAKAARTVLAASTRLAAPPPSPSIREIVQVDDEDKGIIADLDAGVTDGLMPVNGRHSAAITYPMAKPPRQSAVNRTMPPDQSSAPPPSRQPVSPRTGPRRGRVRRLLVTALALLTAAAFAAGAVLVVQLASAASAPFTTVASLTTGKMPAEIALSPDGATAYVTNQGSGTVSVIDTLTGRAVVDPIPVGEKPNSVAVAAGGARAYVTSTGAGTLSVIDTATNRVTTVVPVGGFTDGLAVTPDGRRAYVGVADTGVVVPVDIAAGRVLGPPIHVGEQPYGMALGRNGTQLYVPNYGSDTLSVIDTTRDTVITTVPVGDAPIGVVVSPNGSTLYVANETSGTVTVVDTATNKVLGEPVTIGKTPLGIATSPDGSRIYVTCRDADTMRTMDAADRFVSAGYEVASRPVSIAVAADGRVFVVGEVAGSVSVLRPSAP